MNYEEELNRLKEAQKQAAIASLDKQKNEALSGLQREEAAIKPTYENKRNTANVQNQVNAKNFHEYLINTGRSNSGIGAQYEMSRQNRLASDIGALNRQEAAAMGDIARRRTDVGNAYQSGLAGANAQIESNYIQNLLNERQKAWQREQAEKQFQNQINQQNINNEYREWQKAQAEKQWENQLSQQDWQKEQANKQWENQLNQQGLNNEYREWQKQQAEKQWENQLAQQGLNNDYREWQKEQAEKQWQNQLTQQDLNNQYREWQKQQQEKQYQNQLAQQEWQRQQAERQMAMRSSGGSSRGSSSRGYSSSRKPAQAKQPEISSGAQNFMKFYEQNAQNFHKDPMKMSATLADMYNKKLINDYDLEFLVNNYGLGKYYQG